MATLDLSPFNTFFKRHRAQLQAFLDNEGRIQSDRRQILVFVDSVLEDWDTLQNQRIPPYTREEMTFWFSLYKLESVAEIPQGQPLLRFEEMMFDTLRNCRECLRKKAALPTDLFASRPYFSNGNYSDEYLESWPLLLSEDSSSK